MKRPIQNMTGDPGFDGRVKERIDWEMERDALRSDRDRLRALVGELVEAVQAARNLDDSKYWRDVEPFIRRALRKVETSEP